MSDTKPSDTPRTDERCKQIHEDALGLEYVANELRYWAEELERELASIKDAGDDVVEPERIKYIRVEVECGNLRVYKDFIDHIDTLLSAYKRVCVERDAEKERANTVLKAVKQVASPMSENIKGWKERAEKAEASNKRLTEYATHLPEELWKNYARNGLTEIGKVDFLAALAEYGEAVRAEAKKVCGELLSFDYDDPGQSYAKAIEKMKLP